MISDGHLLTCSGPKLQVTWGGWWIPEELKGRTRTLRRDEMEQSDSEWPKVLNFRIWTSDELVHYSCERKCLPFIRIASGLPERRVPKLEIKRNNEKSHTWDRKSVRRSYRQSKPFDLNDLESKTSGTGNLDNVLGDSLNFTDACMKNRTSEPKCPRHRLLRESNSTSAVNLLIQQFGNF